MAIENIITKYQAQPISHQLLKSLLKDYKRPNDKINQLIQNGSLLSLKRGLYVWNSQTLPERFSIANLLYGPSYISAESALSYRGLIPEEVFSIISMTLKNSKTYINSIGSFEYKKIPTLYYSFGLERVELRENQFAVMATAEKALMDKIISTAGVQFRSTEAAKIFMIENLRIEENYLKKFNLIAMAEWIHVATKKESLNFLIKAIEKL